MQSLGRELRSGAEFRKECSNLLPDLGTSGESAPVDTNKTYEPVANIDRDDIVLGGHSLARVPHAVYEESLDVVFHLAERGIGLHNVVPGLERQ
jgi:hypothetical protein